MATATITASSEAIQLAAMKHVFETTLLPPHYLTRVVYQPMTIAGLATRVQEAFGLGHLYRNSGSDFVFLPEPTIPSHLVLEALRTVALDRVVAEAICTEAGLAADRHSSGLPTTPELGYIPEGCRAADVRDAYLAILQDVLQDPDYRQEVGAELPELF